MADLDKLVDELSKLTVIEAAELSKKLEEAWGVSAAAPVAVAAAAGLYVGLAIGQRGGGSLERLAGSVLTASLAWLPVVYVLMRREAARLAADFGFSLPWRR